MSNEYLSWLHLKLTKISNIVSCKNRFNGMNETFLFHLALDLNNSVSNVLQNMYNFFHISMVLLIRADVVFFN